MYQRRTVSYNSCIPYMCSRYIVSTHVSEMDRSSFALVCFFLFSCFMYSVPCRIYLMSSNLEVSEVLFRCYACVKWLWFFRFRVGHVNRNDAHMSYHPVIFFRSRDGNKMSFMVIITGLCCYSYKSSSNGRWCRTIVVILTVFSINEVVHVFKPLRFLVAWCVSFHRVLSFPGSHDVYLELNKSSAQRVLACIVLSRSCFSPDRLRIFILKPRRKVISYLTE